MNLYTELKDLCLTPSVSGREDKIRNLLEKKISPFVDETFVDDLGNLTALKRGSKERGGENRVMLCAHMDEIGFLVTFIEENGELRVAPVGGISSVASAYSRVISENGVKGVLIPESKVKPQDLTVAKMYIDIGAKNRKEAERHVSVGDFFVAEPNLSRLLGKRVAGRPLDDRVGCLCLLAIAENLAEVTTESDVCFVFSVQEEVGCRGAYPATFINEPKFSLCFDVTGTGDTISSDRMACKLGGGAAIKIKDNSVICHEEIVKLLTRLAEENKIAYQKEILTYGGTDTSAMQLTRRGSKAGALSIPSRYIHSGVESCDLGDVEATISLAVKFIEKVAL